jgi:hypothetical protein
VFAADFDGPAIMDDFGQVRFSNNSHSALSEATSGDMFSEAEALSDIEPAAGPVGPDEENQSAKELEEEYGAPATQTVIDRGDSETLTRDRFGDGEVGVFFENKKDSRINDEQDAIGIEFRLLEFD